MGSSRDFGRIVKRSELPRVEAFPDEGGSDVPIREHTLQKKTEDIGRRSRLEVTA